MTTTTEDPVASLWRDLRDYLTESRQHLDQIARVMRDNGSPAVLETRTVAIGSAGYAERSYRIPYASVAVINPSTSPLFVSSAAGQASVPGPGQGLVIIPAASFVSFNMSGQTISFYGPVGVQLSYTVMTNRIQPAAARLGLTATSVTANGNATSPGALTQIGTCSATLLPGTWQIAWQLMFGGTVSATEVNNASLAINSSIAAVSLNGDSLLTPYPQEVVTVSLAATSTVSIHAINAGTAGAVYYAQLTATPLAA